MGGSCLFLVTQSTAFRVLPNRDDPPDSTRPTRLKETLRSHRSDDRSRIAALGDDATVRVSGRGFVSRATVGNCQLCLEDPKSASRGRRDALNQRGCSATVGVTKKG